MYRAKVKEVQAELSFLEADGITRKGGHRLSPEEWNFLAQKKKLTGASLAAVENLANAAGDLRDDNKVINTTGEGLGWILSSIEPGPFGEMLMGASVGAKVVSRAANSGRSLRMPSMNGSLAGTTTLGETLPNGQVFLRPGLSRAEQVATLRHESVHAYLSVADGAPLATLRQNVGMWGYNNSHLMRFTEEALAEGYASRSLMQGIMHPLQNGYGISIPRLTLEVGAAGAGIGEAAYWGYQLGGGGE